MLKLCIIKILLLMYSVIVHANNLYSYDGDDLHLHSKIQWKINPNPVFKLDYSGNTLAGRIINFQFSNPDGSYHFGYNNLDRDNIYSFREEIRHITGKIMGRYGYSEADGQSNSYEYIADTNGFRIWKLNFEDPENKPTTTTTESPFRVDMSEIMIIGPIPKPWKELDLVQEEESK